MNKIKTSLLTPLGICLFVTASWSTPALSEDSTSALGDTSTLGWTLGAGNTRMISPSGDILDSNMDALSPLQVTPIELESAGLTLEVLKDPSKSKDLINAALYIPTDQEKLADMTTADFEEITVNQKEVLNQASAQVTTFGLKSDQNTDEFEKRRLRALEFIKTAENNREDIQVLTGATLGMVAEMNKMLSLSTNRALLKTGDNLSSTSNMQGE